ncbi:hypothetical protein [Spirilliplanes yamanashiensis]|uniref:Uncharacterized protein n=1 Tax=Spirilliplanes yamanashiensis TaxID=42233 RepID=A0A8J4DH89_9ACTN|nr:hypothetical protein [Spirilliplanes yamanashiensis]MDP9819259.1 hypothetical protein [Spirilliplanes yamanashiensis]GIJ01917.1 hypothetical protein Sya03_12690 [Spirilliplanes yamanashiensis]
MTTTAVRPTRVPPFARHAAEMVLAMLAGMLLFGPLWEPVLSPATLARPDVAALVTATDMAAGMALWMWHRRHGRAAIAGMAVAMYVPFLVLLPPWWAGALPGEAVLLGGHLLMLPAMAAAMLRRRAEYSTAVHPPAPHTLLRRCWPTLLALVVTLDNLIHPTVPPALAMLVLPVGYLVIGAARRTLRPRRELALQLGQLAAYLALAGAALAAGGGVATVLIGVGWLVHAAWDLWYHRRDRVVPRGYAEWCAVVDVVVGGTVLALAVTGT